MTVLMFKKRFVAPIQAGIKRQTIRPKRKRPIKTGEALSLRYWEDKAYRSPQIEFGTGVALGTIDITVLESGIVLGDGSTAVVTDIDAFARSDGFANWADMKEFFTYGMPFSGDLIQWEDAK